MARDPNQLLTRLDKKHREMADAIERGIDQALDERYAGGRFVHTLYETVPAPVAAEIRRRYPLWVINFEPTSTGFNESGTRVLMDAATDPRGQVR